MEKKMLLFRRTMKTVLFLAVLSICSPNVWAQSGDLGNGLTWNIEGTTLTISKTGEGSGEISNQGWENKPWTNVTQAIIGEGVTGIGDLMFYGCSYLEGISIAEGVTSIGDYAFYLCFSLTDITLPSTLQTIGVWAFADCRSISGEFVIPANVVSIGELAFLYCYEFTSFVVDENNAYYKSVDGVLFSKDGENLIFFPAQKKGTYSIPDGTTTIGNYAFEGSALTGDLIIPEGVKIIGNSAFINCYSITGLSLPSTLENLENRAFAYCKNMTSISVDDSNMNYKSIEGVLFSKNEESLISYPAAKAGTYTIPESVIIIEEYAFASGILTGVSIPDNVTTIGNAAFVNCSNISEITIPTSVTTIGNQAFTSCYKLTDLIIKKTTPPTIGFGAFDQGDNICLNIIHVPIGSENAYKTASGYWSDYSHLIRGTETGLPYIGASQLSIYPNPTTGPATITGLTNGDLIKIYNMSGTLVGTYTAAGEELTIDISNLSKGTYLLKTNTGSFKIIKN